MSKPQAPEYRLPESKPGTTERQIRLYNPQGDLAKTYKCRPTTTNMTLVVKDGWTFRLFDLPDEKPVVEFVVPAKMPHIFNLAEKCLPTAVPPTLLFGEQPEQSLVQTVQEPVTLQQSVGVQVVRAEDPMTMPPAERLAKGYRPAAGPDGKVQWTKE